MSLFELAHRDARIISYWRDRALEAESKLKEMQDGVADWFTIAPKYRTKKRLIRALKDKRHD